MANLAFVVGVCLAFVASASASLGPYNVDTTKISVSGLSAGGFMAVQFHVAYSASIMGSAVFAGGPYFCAQGSVITAQTTCMAVPLALNVDPLISKVKGLSNADIDDPSNLRRAKVFTYSGTKDSVVNPGVVKKLNDFYAAFVDASNMATELTIASQHCIPTLNYGEACATLGSPYIGKCNYDGAGVALQHIYGNLSASVAPVASNLLTFSQGDFTTSSSMDKDGYVYVPTACQQNATCRLHVAFHGCEQGHSSVGMDYVEDAGYNGWAEANNIIVLYPQVLPTSMLGSNPKGCFDWWGYTDSKYAYKSGAQMSAVKKMIDAITTH